MKKKVILIMVMSLLVIVTGVVKMSEVCAASLLNMGEMQLLRGTACDENCKSAVPCAIDTDCEIFGSTCITIMSIPAMGGTIGTYSPVADSCARKFIWTVDCIVPTGGCGGTQAWPDAGCG